MPEPGSVALSDGVVRLRPLEPSDAADVFAACQDSLIARFIPIPQPYTMAAAEAFAARRVADWETKTEASFAIVDDSGGAFLGTIARHGPTGHHVSFGYWLSPAARGHGVATRALRLIVAWTMATTSAIRFEVWTDVDNEASGRVALRAGFAREGIRRAWSLDRDGRPEDAVFYVLVRDGPDPLIGDPAAARQ